jgi:hypothetical protein
MFKFSAREKENAFFLSQIIHGIVWLVSEIFSAIA